MRIFKNFGLFILLLALVLSMSSCNEAEKDVVSASPEIVNIWTYYSDEQRVVFNEMIDTFNREIGRDKGIIVKQQAFSSNRELGEYLISSVKGDAGAYDVPNMYIGYRGIDNTVRQYKDLIDFYEYYSEDELDKYIDAFVKAGVVHTEDGDKLHMFPIAKSTTIVMLNDTDYKKAMENIGVDYSDLSSFESLVETAKKYYEYTDSLTEKKDDGQALFGIDSVINYFLVGAKSLHGDFLEVRDGKTVLNIDKETIRKLWDYYYVPMVKGYFIKEAKYATQDIKIGNSIASLGSTAGTIYFPKQKYINDEGFDIELKILSAPYFNKDSRYFALQGGGVFGISSTEKKNKACVEFIKWITKPEINTRFAINAGYLPVTKEAFSEKFIEDYITKNDMPETLKKTLIASYEQYSNMTPYAHDAVDGYNEIRSLIGDEFDSKSKKDSIEVRKRVANGEDKQKVLEKYLSDEYFEKWYDSFIKKANVILEENR